MPALKRPNVILIMTDQHRGDCLGVSGHPLVETPHLDGLANDGTNFTRAYTACPSCVPARAVLMTGQTPWHTGILGMGQGQGRLRSDYAHTMAGVLAGAGYHTQLVGKMHFQPPRALNGFHNTVLDEHAEGAGFKSDYQAWFEEHAPPAVYMREHMRDWNTMDSRPFHLPEWLHPTNWTARESINFIERRDPEKPFLLVTSFIRPHSPYDPPQPYWDMYARKEVPGPVVGDWAHVHDVPRDGRSITAWRGKRSPEEEWRARVGYYGSISHVDNQIGNLLSFLKKEGVYHNSLIIFTADHGDMMGDHNLWRKTYAYEGSARIPLIVKFPNSMGLPQGSTCEEPAELRDVMPTMLDVAGVPVPDTVDGLSLRQACAGTGSLRDYVHGEHCTCYSSVAENQFVTDGTRKFIWFPRTGDEQFFDLEQDPDERHNAIGDLGREDEIELWRGRLIDELSARDCGLVEDGRLVVRQEPIVSPWRDKVRGA